MTNPRTRSKSRRTEALPGSKRMWKVAAVLWSDQVDAAAGVDAVADGGGGAPRSGSRGRRRRGRKGGKEDGFQVLFIRSGARVRRANPGAGDFGSPAVALIITDQQKETANLR